MAYSNPLDVTQDQQRNLFPQAEAAPVEHPERIGRYRIEKILGKGGFGLVYLAHDEQLDRRVAVKVPHAKLISGPEDAEAYLTEARAAANFDHAHIVPVFDVGSTEDCPCFESTTSPPSISSPTVMPRRCWQLSVERSVLYPMRPVKPQKSQKTSSNNRWLVWQKKAKSSSCRRHKSCSRGVSKW